MKGKYVIMTKKKLIIRSKFSFTLAISLMTVAIVAFTTSSYGWFSNNTNVNSTGMGVSVSSNAFSANFEYLQYDVKQESYIVSSGMADFNEKEDNTYRAVFIRADKKMYERKELLKKK